MPEPAQAAAGATPTPTDPQTPADNGTPPAGGPPAAQDGADGAVADGAPEAPPQADSRAAYLKQLEINKQQQSLMLKLQKQVKDLEGRASEYDGVDKLGALELLQKFGKTPDALTAELMQANDLTPEQKKLQEMESELNKLRDQASEREKQEQTARQQQITQQAHAEITESLESREDLAYSAAAGHAPIVYEAFKNFAAEHGVAPSPEQQEELALKIESETRQLVHKQVGDLYKKSSAFREYLATLANAGDGSEPGTPSDPKKPDQPVSSGQNGKGKKPEPQTLTRSQATAVETRTSGQRRLTREERRANAFKRLNGG